MLGKKLRHRLAHEPLAWAVLGLGARIGAVLRNRLLARALGAPGLQVGKGSSFVGMRHVRFGRSFRAHGAVWIEAVTAYAGQRFTPSISIGNDVAASNDLHISCIEQVSIGDHVLFGSRVYISDHNHGDYRGETRSTPDSPPAGRPLGGGGPVVIGNNVWIGHNVVIIGPAEIGEGAVIGANSVVRGRVAAGTIVGGAPGRPLKQFDPATRRWKGCR